MELIGYVMSYAWGKVGKKSIVAHLASLNNKEFCLEPNTPYSELWMGDHVNGPAKLKATGANISTILPNNLPFLFKVLSVRQALSIQVHPNKEEAAILHKNQPDIYKDPNHKPEMAIALTPFLALCGFRTPEQIYEICQRIRPLKAVIGENVLENLKESKPENLRAVFKKWMYATDQQMLRCLYEINKEYRPELCIYGLLDIFKRLNKEFPNDVGVLAIFFLNVIRLSPGQSIYLGANEIHAYLDGDCIECMACSDNVIRAGLTPKFKDKKQLVASTKCEGTPPQDKIFKPNYVDMYQTIYAPPVDDFAVVRLKLPVERGAYEWDFKGVDSILIVVHGAGKIIFPEQCREFEVSRGSIFYIPPDAGDKIIFQATECEECENEPEFSICKSEELTLQVEVELTDVDRKQLQAILNSQTMDSTMFEIENFVEHDIDIEKFSSGFKDIESNELSLECEEGYEEQSSLNEKLPGKEAKKDFEIYIASSNVYKKEEYTCEKCEPEKETKKKCKK